MRDMPSSEFFSTEEVVQVGQKRDRPSSDGVYGDVGGQRKSEGSKVEIPQLPKAMDCSRQFHGLHIDSFPFPRSERDLIRCVGDIFHESCGALPTMLHASESII